MVKLSNSTLDGIIVAAVEGGINYWARVQGYNAVMDDNDPVGCKATVIEQESSSEGPPKRAAIDREAIRKALDTIEQKQPKLYTAFLKSYMGEVGEYAPDASLSDCILQYAMFGEEIYG